MAINLNGILHDENPNKTICFSNNCNMSSCRLIKINFPKKGSFSSSKSSKLNNNKDLKSPYLNSDKLQILNGTNEKKLIHKNPATFISSFPLANCVYKANSDDFKVSKRANKKVKKSVLTLPNDPVPMPKTCTVSDLNDSEYFTDTNNSRANKSKKRRPVKRKQKPRTRERARQYCNRNSQYCSQLNIDLDCSSSEIVNYNGDGERISKVTYKSNNSAMAGNDVWAILRNLNKVQFRPSATQEIVVPRKKRMALKPERKGNSRNDTHIIETCHTEEFAYVSSFEIDNKSHDTCSPSSSFDRVTVIDKQSEQGDIMQQFSQKLLSRLNSGNKKNVESKKKIEVNKTPAKNIHNQILQVERDFISTFPSNQFLSECQANKDKKSEVSINSETCHGSVIESVTRNETSANNDRNNDIYCNNNRCNKLNVIHKNLNSKVTLTKGNSDTEKQASGITQAVLSKGQNIVSSLSKAPWKPRLALTLPYSKLTLVEIRRQLASLKFPIIILGKDQITNCAIHVANYDPSQFYGLDRHIWPFMSNWLKKTDKQGKGLLNMKSEIPKVTHRAGYLSYDSSNSDIVSKANHKENNYFSIDNVNTQKLITGIPSRKNRKPISIDILKTKQFQFLKNDTTKTPIRNISNNHDGRLNNEQKYKTDCKGVINQTVYSYPERVPRNELINKLVENRLIKKSYPLLKQPWAQAKWKSDFIENIVEKIRNGVYYSVDRTDNKNKMNSAEVSTQTEKNMLRNAYCQNNSTLDAPPSVLLYKKDNNQLNCIPGFDKTLPTLEIETISKSQIAIKQCITNVVVHFDVQILAEADNMAYKNNSALCTPLHIKDNQEKIFKCNTSILNANLPAELCSIIPTMMQNILSNDTKLCQPPAILEIFEPHVTNTSVLTELKTEIPEVTSHYSLPGPLISDQIRPILKGGLPLLCCRHAINNNKNIYVTALKSRDMHIKKLYPRDDAQVLWTFIQPLVILNATKNTFNGMNVVGKKDTKIANRILSCTALQAYEPRQLRIIPSFGVFDAIKFMNEIVNKLNVNEFSYTYRMQVTIYDYDYNRNNTMLPSKPLILQQGISQNSVQRTNISKLGVISLYEAIKSNEYDEEIVNESPAYTGIEKKLKVSMISESNKIDLRKKCKPIKNVRKKSYPKYYRKCFSLSSISSYNCTSLNAIRNLDDFCQALGSNLLSSVLSGCPEKKILAAITQMRNWITEITPKQALLVLLLTNKKDTPNLIRFRPVLLQGIAVNRITRAVELDTEIEVIEREHFNKLSQFEGISYLPASVENQDNLLEELYWIAKTTASDYQKTFDESSEQLLKSLLEKRKKLNPSYLRVMARYVGLGLLTLSK